jgi:hypothetical protein
VNHNRTFLVLSLTVLFIISTIDKSYSFGFYAHRKINRMAIFTLPPEMFSFYKKHIEYITEHSIDPDKRSRVVEGEDKKHYIDLEYYGEHPFDTIPILWTDAIALFSEDTLQRYGINPWWVNKMTYSLMQAFKDEDLDNILYISTCLGHYISDACTPLHTTKWYDGKTFEQKGIHAFWETRIPELEADNYRYILGRAKYIDKPNQYFWQLIRESHEAVDTIFRIDSFLKSYFPDDKKYVYQERSSVLSKQFSKVYSEEFEKLSRSMVERRIKLAVMAVSSAWFTSWVNAGQPDLSRLQNRKISKAHQKELMEIEKMWKTGKPIGRPNPEE